MEAESLNSVAVSSVLIVGLTVLGLVIVKFLARQAQRYVESLDPVPVERRQQTVTLVQVLRWAANIAIVASAILMLLTTFDINVGPLLASVGVMGLALGLGAQSLIKDYVGGFLILVENQFSVGDVVEVGGVTGTVEGLTLRATRLRSADGDLVFVPNGDARVVANKTRGWSQVVVDVGVAYEEDLDRALHVLEESAAAFAADPAVGPRLLEPPAVLGVVSLGDSAANVRITVKTQPGEQFGVGRMLRKQLLATCEQEGVSLPYPRQEVWVRSLQDAAPSFPEER